MVKYALCSWEGEVWEWVLDDRLDLWVVNEWNSTAETPDHAENVVDGDDLDCDLLFVEFHQRTDTLEYRADVGSNLDQSRGEWLIELLFFDKGLLKGLRKEPKDKFLVIFLKIHFPQPALNIERPVKIIKRQVDHTTTWDRSRRCHSQVLYLKKHPQFRSELDSLRIGQTQRHVIIQDCIHVLNPKRINRPIKHNPVLFVGVPVCFINFWCVDITNDWTGKTVDPLLCKGVYLTVHFAHWDWFGVEDTAVGLLEAFDVFLLHDRRAVR